MRKLDTHSKVEKVRLRIFRKMEPEKKLELSFMLCELVKAFLKEGVKNRHPEYSDDEIELAVQKILLGEELFKKVYPSAKNISP